MTFLVEAYTEDEAPNTKGGVDKRMVLRLDPRLAPTKVAVLPLSRNADLSPKAKDLAAELRRNWNVDFDDSGAIGRRYRRQDEVGTPYCVTVDFETLDDHAVTVRERDSMAQERVGLDRITLLLRRAASSAAEPAPRTLAACSRVAGGAARRRSGRRAPAAQRRRPRVGRPGSRPSATPSASPYLPVPDGVELTPQGTELDGAPTPRSSPTSRGRVRSACSTSTSSSSRRRRSSESFVGLELDAAQTQVDALLRHRQGRQRGRDRPRWSTGAALRRQRPERAARVHAVRERLRGLPEHGAAEEVRARQEDHGVPGLPRAGQGHARGGQLPARGDLRPDRLDRRGRRPTRSRQPKKRPRWSSSERQRAYRDRFGSAPPAAGQWRAMPTADAR